MRPASSSFWQITAILAVLGLGIFVVDSVGPQRAASAPTAAAATELKMYLRIEGIEGECTGDLHKGCMEVLAYDTIHIWGDPHVTEGGTGNELGLTVTRNIDKATPLLFDYCCRRTVIPTVTLELWREGGAVSQKVMVYTHHDSCMSAIRNVRSLAAADTPMEELTFTSATAEWSYTEYDASGKPKGDIRSTCDGFTRQ
jgi:type VI secretion system secreted protein Hcp